MPACRARLQVAIIQTILATPQLGPPQGCLTRRQELRIEVSADGGPHLILSQIIDVLNETFRLAYVHLI